ncbi:MAG TPA: nuclear transport factor 2 family protein [Mycobacteriales bacterium]|nr:nuclear transport factor 2 family protein [Mycobacteriales bacterium]
MPVTTGRSSTSTPIALADLYAPDAVHHFPFRFPGFPDRYDGREQVRAGYRAAWHSHPVRPTGIREVVVHQGADPEVIVGEFALSGRVTATGGPFSLNGVLMLRVRDGLITEVRDYLDALAVTTQLGKQ